MSQVKKVKDSKAKKNIRRAAMRTSLSADFHWAKEVGILGQYDWAEFDYSKNSSPILASLRSGEALPRHLRLVIIDLLQRYNLRPKRGVPKIPFYRLSDTEARINAAKWELAQLGHVNQISREEMDEALEIESKRAGRSKRSLDAKAAAQTVRKRQRKEISKSYGLRASVFESAIAGKLGAARRRKHDPVLEKLQWGEMAAKPVDLQRSKKK